MALNPLKIRFRGLSRGDDSYNGDRDNDALIEQAATRYQKEKIDMTEQRNAMAELFAACWKDDALKARFMSDPKAVLAERGIDLPDGIDINVVENSDNTVHITMPKAPDGATELADDELRGAAAGCQGFFSWSCNSKC